MAKKNIVNAHAHVFTSRFVPPFLAKTIIPWPLYYLINTHWLVALAKLYFSYKNRYSFPGNGDSNKSWDKIYSKRRSIRSATLRSFNLKSKPYLHIPFRIITYLFSIVAALYIIEFLANIFGLEESIAGILDGHKTWLGECALIFELPTWGKILWTIGVLIFINWSRRVIWFLISKLFPFFSSILSSNGMELLERYILMGRFSFYGSQQQVAQRALNQMPPGSELVILPMDMEYMGAGKSKMSKEMLDIKKLDIKKANTNDEETNPDYKNIFTFQMYELYEFVRTRRKSQPTTYHPFLFLDPRRIAEEGTSFFDYDLVNGRMVLKDCFVKTYMEVRKFSGFKIYPALGYYVFDEHLLPIWRYASENNIPIMTHCVIGVIYYRGSKKKEWNFHPVFKQFYKDKRHNEAEPMLLPQTKAVDLQFNFTHPLNYLCLLEEQFLRELVGNAENKSIQALFGYTNAETPLDYTLENLKICLAHYGGEEEWTKYLETDRDVYSRSLVTNPDEGIDFMKNSKGKLSWSKINSLWHDTDWYSLISSMLMRYENVYADLSYIISKPSIYPLLTQTLEKGKGYEEQFKEYQKETSDNKKAFHLTGRNRLRSHILYGTDFYVVRNHNSDKDLFAQTRAALDEESFDLIARENTHNYLSRN